MSYDLETITIEDFDYLM